MRGGGGGGGRAPEGECLWGGRGAKYFFFGAEMPTRTFSPPLVSPACLPLTGAAIRKWGSGKGVFWKRWSFQKSPCSRDSREFRDSRDSREPPRVRVAKGGGTKGGI